VKNQSDQVAAGTWSDSLFLSEDAVWDITDRPLGRASFTGALQPDGSYSLTLDTLMPAAAPGQYRVIVRTDVFNQVYEGVNEANNRTASPSTLEVSVDAMQIGAPLTTSLEPKQEKLFQIQVPDGQTLRVTLKSSDPASTNEIFIRHDRAPSSSVYDATYTGPLSSDLTAIVPSTEPGTYYLLVRNFSAGPEGTEVTLLAELLPLLITDVRTDTGGDSRHVTTTISGAQFQNGAIVKLVRPGIAEYEPLVWKVIDSTKIIATFDFTGAPHGLYDLKVINPDGSEAIVPYRFLIERAIEPEVTIGLGGPRIILAGDQATYSVALQGISNLDSPYTYF
jgi:large repetitive protein